jgi:hypothetical protein
MNGPQIQSSPTTALPPTLIKIGKATVMTKTGGKQIEATVFTMSLGAETIELWPFKNWGQLDVHKWCVRGRLPAVPAGLEVTSDHIKIAGESVSVTDAAACSKLEKAVNEWLAVEKGTLELAKKKSQPKPNAVSAQPSSRPEEQPLRYIVEMDHENQVHIKCVQGKESLAEIGLNIPGWNSLANQGLLRKPSSLSVGALHDWVELDGELYSFEKGQNDSARLEKVLNEKYLSSAALGKGKDVVVFTNAASSTGFDIQFAVTVGGVPDKRRRPLNEETLDLLQDHNRCGVLHKNLVVKLTRPTLIFKQKTPDGGEKYLERSPENVVNVTGDDGTQKAIDLSQPVNYLHLSAVELTAVFNHPAINQHSKAAPQEDERPVATLTASPPKAEPVASVPALPRQSPPPEPPAVPSQTKVAPPVELAIREMPPPSTAPTPQQSVTQNEPQPNSWLEPVLAMPPMRFDWFARLIYGQLAEKFGNCQEASFGPTACWHVAMGETTDFENFEYHGVFLTEKGSLGFLNHGHMARFYKSVAFIGTQESALEGIDVQLIGVGLDTKQRVVFIVATDFLNKFGVAERVFLDELERLKQYGAVLLSPQQALKSSERIEVLWTVPDEQADPDDPAALESIPDVPELMQP